MSGGCADCARRAVRLVTLNFMGTIDKVVCVTMNVADSVNSALHKSHCIACASVRLS